ncbi:hypothetical protein KR222_011456 [Zaprionus bogoriensis]|nr:hypothetical protein KR222_011456 [Zaprionus bogoriensis]
METKSSQTQEQKITSIAEMSAVLEKHTWNFAMSEYSINCTLKARVTVKTQVQTYQNDRGSGKFFSIFLMDESGEIEATSFDESDYDRTKLNGVYLFFNGLMAKAIEPQYDPKNKFQIIFSNRTSVVKVDDEGGIPQAELDLRPIEEIRELEDNDSVDVIGLCANVGELQAFISMNDPRYEAGKLCRKRELTLVDQRNDFIVVTIWGDRAEFWPVERSRYSVILVKKSHYRDYKGQITLTASYKTTLIFDPDIPEATELRTWFNVRRNETAVA